MAAPVRVLVLFGSQTGCAKSIAESVHTSAQERGYASVLAPLNAWKKVGFEKARFAIVVSSTTGEGDPPDNADRFWRFIKRRTNASDMLLSLQYVVLGVGDSSYAKFCHIPKGIDAALAKCGARRFAESCFADEATGLEETVEPWLVALWKPLAVASGGTLAVVPRDRTAASAAGAGGTTGEGAIGASGVRKRSADAAPESSASASPAAALAVDPPAPPARAQAHGYATTAAIHATQPPVSSTPDELDAEVQRVKAEHAMDREAYAATQQAERQRQAAALAARLARRNEQQGGVSPKGCAPSESASLAGAAPPAGTALVVMYGSQHGCAQSIAEGVHASAQERGYASVLAPLNAWKKVGFEKARFAIVVSSTTGEGDPPDNADRFWRFIKRRTNASDMLLSLQYVVLGVGDSSYAKFCHIPKGIDSALAKCGARRFAESCFADEATGLEETVEPWTTSLWAPLGAAARTAVRGAGAGQGAGADSSGTDARREAEAQAVSATDVSAASRPTVEVGGAPSSGPGAARGRNSSATGPEARVTPGEPLRVPRTDLPRLVPRPGLLPYEAVVSFAEGVAGGPADAASESRVDAPARLPACALRIETVKPRRDSDATSVGTPLSSTSPAPPSENNDDDAEHGYGRGRGRGRERDRTQGGSASRPPRSPVVQPSRAGACGGRARADSATAASGGAAAGAGAPAEARTPRAQALWGAQRTSGSSRRRVGSASSPASPSISPRLGSTAPPGEDRTNPVLARVKVARYLTTAASHAEGRRVMHVEFDVSDCGGLTWQPGDAIGVLCPNPRDEVDAILRRLGEDPDALVRLDTLDGEGLGASDAHGRDGRAASRQRKRRRKGTAMGLFESLPTPCTLRHVVSTCTDIATVPKKAMLRLLAEHATGADKSRLMMLCSRGGRDEYMSFVERQKLGLFDLLSLFPTTQPPLATLLSILPPHAPRYYSIASSPLVQPDTIGVALTVLEYATGPEGRCPRKGLCSNFLEQLVAPLLLKGDVPVPATVVAAAGAAKAAADEMAAEVRRASEDAVGTPRRDSADGYGDLSLPPLALDDWSVTPAAAADVDAEHGGKSGGDAGVLQSPARVRRRSRSRSSSRSRGPSDAKSPLLGPAGSGFGGGALATAGSPGEDDGPPAARVAIFLKRARDFVLPSNAAYPLIMIGPGTGVAPFVGFLKHREAQRAAARASVNSVCSGAWRHGFDIDELEDDPEFRRPTDYGDAILFFGCRKADRDYLYAGDLQALLRGGALTRLHTAFSRQYDTKVYVQHHIRAHGGAVANLILRDGARVYVCGDGQRMARDVHAALVDVLSEHGRMSVSEADATLKELASRQRYVRDIWLA